MKATIVTCFESNEPRVSLIKEAFECLGYRTTVITTNYSHMNKTLRDNIPAGYLKVDTKPYQKNLSFDRIQSHIDFSKKAFDLAERQVPDILWLCAPANSLIKEAKEFKSKYPLVKIIVDVIDMWPESLPTKFGKGLLPFTKWRDIRKNNISCADRVVCECDLYKEILEKEYSNPVRRIYWGKNTDIKPIDYVKDEDRLHLVYLGSINNIIDIDSIQKMISSFDKKVTLHIIGDGENREKMISALEKVCRVEYHGVIHDEKKKSKILSKCHAGINLYKKGLYIGLTEKCIDYFANGLPIINNISYDTWEMVRRNRVGINLDADTIINEKRIYHLRDNYQRIYDFYNKRFTKEVIIKQMTDTINEAMQ